MMIATHLWIARRCDAQRMAIQTAFAKKVAGSQDCNDRFLALLGNDGEFDLALLDVKNRVRDLSLRKDNLILEQRFSSARMAADYVQKKGRVSERSYSVT